MLPLFDFPRQEDDEVLPGAPEFDSLSDNGLLSRNEPIRSKVSKLTEKLRKRYPTNNTGTLAPPGCTKTVLRRVCQPLCMSTSPAGSKLFPLSTLGLV